MHTALTQNTAHDLGAVIVQTELLAARVPSVPRSLGADQAQ
jgi:hypothetical protein